MGFSGSKAPRKGYLRGLKSFLRRFGALWVLGWASGFRLGTGSGVEHPIVGFSSSGLEPREFSACRALGLPGFNYQSKDFGGLTQRPPKGLPVLQSFGGYARQLLHRSSAMNLQAEIPNARVWFLQRPQSV